MDKLFFSSNNYIFGLRKIKMASAHDGQRPNELAASLPMMGKGESVLLLVFPRWARSNLFCFLLAQFGQRQIRFTSCLPKLGRAGFFFASAQTGQSCGKRKSVLGFYLVLFGKHYR